eukprot:3393385-Prymnesium_polylepis.1
MARIWLDIPKIPYRTEYRYRIVSYRGGIVQCSAVSPVSYRYRIVLVSYCIVSYRYRIVSYRGRI